VSHSYRYVGDDGNPLTLCPVCCNDLTEEEGVNIVLSVSGRVIDVPSRLDEEGNLEDTDDNVVANGYHSGTYCGHCSELLSEWELAV
jgi:hypothetical protein